MAHMTIATSIDQLKYDDMRDAAHVTIENITPEFVLTHPNLSEYQFGGVPKYTMYTPERAEEAKKVWEAYNATREKIVNHLANKIPDALTMWNAKERYESALNIFAHNKPERKPRYMWGKVTHKYGAGAGMKFLACEGHGGIMVSLAREAGIHPALRQGCAYEEDVDVAIIAMFYPDEFFKCKAFTASTMSKNKDSEEYQEALRELHATVVRYHMIETAVFTETDLDELDGL